MARYIDPHGQPDQFKDRRGGVPTRRDITGDHRRLERNQERKGIQIQTDDTNVLSSVITKLRFKGSGIVAAIVGGAAEITVDVNPPTAYLTTDIDLGPTSTSGRFVIEDDAITDDMIVFVQHVGMHEDDDEGEMDAIYPIPNPPSVGRVVVNWQAFPGPVSGPRAFRYWFATAS